MNLYKRLGLAAVALTISMIVIVNTFNMHTAMENKILLLILNTVFVGLVPLAVSILAAGTYRKNGTVGALFVCCGMLVFGLGAIVTSLLRFSTESPNAAMTVYNCSILVCAFL
jgi:hypothetical protein